MVTENSSALVQYETPRGEVSLSIEQITKYLCPKARPDEAMIFLKKCQYMRLNPFLDEAYLVIYEATDKTPRGAAFIIGKDAYTRRADLHPNYAGHTDGVIVMRNGEAVELEGMFLLPTDQLAGGWCEVNRNDRTLSRTRVTLSEYHKGTHFWKERPATMINKVAVCHALEAAFPNVFVDFPRTTEADLYDGHDVVEGTGRVAPEAHVSSKDQVAWVDQNGEAQVATVEDELPILADPDEVEDLGRTLNRDLDALEEPHDLLHACYEDFGLQPAETLRLLGFSRGADLAAQDLKQLYWQMNETQKRQAGPALHLKSIS